MGFKLALTSAALLAGTAHSGAAFAQESSGGAAEGNLDLAGNDTYDAELVVTARAAKLYRVEETASGKLPTEPLASSQMITVITKELIEDQGARDAQDLYRNISGVSFFSYAGVTARGFRQQENFYDGLRGDPYIGFSVPQLFNIERVEFLKGPAGMLYGQTAPGGLFNYVTKVPSFDFGGKAGLVAGNFDRYGGQAEVTGPVTNFLAVRAGAFYEKRDLPRNHAANESMILDGSATLDLDVAKFTIQALRVEQDLPGNRLRGIPVNIAGDFVADPSWNHNEPSDFLRLRSTSFQARGEFDVTENLKIDGIIRRIDATERQKYHEPTVTFSASDVVSDVVARQYRDQVRVNDILSLATNATWSAELSATVSNRFLVGYDYSDARLTFDNRSWNGTKTTPLNSTLPCPLSLSNPVYGQCDPTKYDAKPYVRSITDTIRTGYYALNELTLGRVIAIVGIRHDSFNDISSATVRFKGGDETYRAGLVWRVREDLSLFGQWSTSFEPQGASAQDVRAGGPFEPTIGESFEGGVKTALLGGRIQSTLSAYHIVRKNLLQSTGADPEGDGVTNSVQFGEVRSQGIDIDLAVDITPDWVVTANYSYNDTIITKDNGNTPITNALGKRFVNAPRHKLGFWTRYQFPEPGIAVAFGGDYVSERFGFDGQRVKPYFVFDGSVTWTRGPWEVRARVDNIFDKTYAASGFSRSSGHFPGEPRTAFLEVGYRF